jgi:diaminopimelate epimerase
VQELDGNDFVLLDGRTPGVCAPDVELSRRLCDRRLGVGADGVLWVLPPPAGEAGVTMVVHNADGSRPEACGNGLRCVALHCGAAVVHTDCGPRRCAVLPDGRVRAEMGWVSRHGARYDVGNPHRVLFVDDNGPDAVAERGPGLSAPTVADGFPEGANVGFARVLAPGRVSLAVYERGVGPTAACGSGACAAALASLLLEGDPEGAADVGGIVTVDQPGGSLIIDVGTAVGEGGSRRWPVTMTGPAARVFSGDWPAGRARPARRAGRSSSRPVGSR